MQRLCHKWFYKLIQNYFCQHLRLDTFERIITNRFGPQNAFRLRDCGEIRVMMKVYLIYRVGLYSLMFQFILIKFSKMFYKIKILSHENDNLNSKIN